MRPMRSKFRRWTIHLLLLSLLPMALAGESSVQITWDFENQSLRDVLREIADVYEIGFVFSDDIVDQVKITCHIEGLSFRDAIALILREANLDYQLLPHEVMVITPKDEPNFILPEKVVILHKNEPARADTLRACQTIFPMPMRTPKADVSLKMTAIQQGNLGNEPVIQKKSCTWIGQNAKNFSAICGGDQEIPSDLLPFLHSTEVMDDLETDPTDANRAITLDGIPLYHPNHLSGFVSSINREAVSSVEWLPVSWNQNINFGLSGLIHLETPHLRPDSSAVSLRLHSLGIAAQTVLSPRKDVQTLIAYRSSYPKNLSPGMDSGFERLMWIARKNADLSDLESSDFTWHDLTAKFQITAIQNMPISVTVLDTRDQTDAADQTGTSGNFHETFENTGFALGTEYFWNLCHQTKLDLAYSFYENTASYANPFYSSNAYQETDRMAHLTVNLQDQWLLAPEWKLNFNAGLNRQNLEHDFKENELLNAAKKINTQFHSAIHVAWLSGPGSEWNARLNLKYSVLQEAIYAEPAASWARVWSPATRLGIQYARSVRDVIRLPHTFYTPISKLTNDFWLIPDSPATTNSLTFMGASKLLRWHIDGQIRLNQISNMPCLLPETEMENISTRQDFYEGETGLGETKGAEFSGTLTKAYGHFETEAMYHFQYQKNQFDDLNNGQSFPPANRRHKARFGLRYTSAAWQLSAGYTLASGKNYTHTEPEYLITPLGVDYLPHVNDSEDINAFQLPWYNRLDLHAAYCFWIWGSVYVKTGLSVFNILDHENIVSPYHYDLNSGIPQVIQNTHGLGRTGWMFLEVML